ncbi:hypothetical protein [uncultured Pseudosulfitobacter sp.]|uniref:hypothetical protein n=1 Tax=uncultured Pseudosulfitobacter sp. TaxID=2854214 RepID=UPI0030D9F78C|tara:strand:- start:2268 stop:2483 length:216 start_codon:yes stop_codon:yes gene_type:complete
MNTSTIKLTREEYEVLRDLAKACAHSDFTRDREDILLQNMVTQWETQQVSPVDRLARQYMSSSDLKVEVPL